MCRDFRHKSAHTSWLPRHRSWLVGDLQKWEISGKMRDESWRPLGKVARHVNFCCKAVGEITKITQNAQEQCKKPQLQCNTLLIYLCRDVWRAFSLFRGNFRTALSQKRNWPWSTTVTNICKCTQRVGCLWKHEASKNAPLWLMWRHLDSSKKPPNKAEQKPNQIEKPPFNFWPSKRYCFYNEREVFGQTSEMYTEAKVETFIKKQSSLGFAPVWSTTISYCEHCRKVLLK